MSEVEFIGGPADGIEGFVESPPEVMLIRDATGSVWSYELDAAPQANGRRFYRRGVCVGVKPWLTAKAVDSVTGEKGGQEG